MKEIPCIILQYNSANASSPNTIVAPITHTTSRLPIVVPIADQFDSTGKLILDGNVLLGNVTCVSTSEFLFCYPLHIQQKNTYNSTTIFL